MKLILGFLCTACLFYLIIVPCICDNQENQSGSNSPLIGVEIAKNKLVSYINSHLSDEISISKEKGLSDASLLQVSSVKSPSDYLYEFQLNDSTYKVNAVTGQIDGVISYNQVSGEIKYTIEQGEPIAKKYLIQLFPEFSNRTIQLLEKTSYNYSESKIYSYSWGEFIKNVKTPNYVSISINPVLGSLDSFNSHISPITIDDLVPKVTQDKSILVVKEKYHFLDKITSISSVLAIDYMDYGKQKLVWEVSIKGEEGMSSIWNTEYIDAFSGIILPAPPLQITF